MKKVTCLALALLLCLTSVCAMAEAVPSKTTADLVKTEVTFAGSNVNAEKVVFEVVSTVVDETAEAELPVEIVEKKKVAAETCNTQLQKLTEAVKAVAVPVAAEGAEVTEEQKKEAAVAQTKAVETYFGDVVAADGQKSSLTKVLGTETATVEEFFPMVVSGLEKDCGDAVVKLAVANVYTAEDKVVVLAGLVAADGTITWQALETTVAADGSLEVKFTEEVLLAMQENTCIMSVVRG